LPKQRASDVHKSLQDASYFHSRISFDNAPADGYPENDTARCEAPRRAFMERNHPTMKLAAFGTPQRRDLARRYAYIIVGCALGALSYPLFLTPNNIAPGGVTGIATIINYLFGLPTGMVSLVLNIPLFLIGWRQMGKLFLIRTSIATVLFSVLIDLIKVDVFTRDSLMASVFGGVLLGIGLGLILRGGATTGGTDLLARLVHQKIPVITVGAFLFAFDVAVIIMAGFTMSAEHAMHAMICVYITSRVLDFVLAGFGTDKSCNIITSKDEVIASRLMDELGRGVTLFDATGAYSGQGVRMVLCIVGRMEVTRLKQIVQEEDPRAFMFITDTHETLGEGFRGILDDGF
jgi:uncharacterized membrane-anchored protein YitT (DUF2179 family)